MQITNIPNPTSPVGGQTDFILVQGETVNPVLTFSDTEGAIDLTGYTGKMEIVAPLGSSSILLTTSNGGLVITDAAAGELQINIAPAVTAVMTAGSHSYDLFLTNPSAVEKAYLGGKFKIQTAISPVP